MQYQYFYAIYMVDMFAKHVWIHHNNITTELSKYGLYETVSIENCKNYETFPALIYRLQIMVQKPFIRWWLIHWGRVTHIYVNTLTIIGPDNGLSPG